MSMYRNKRSSTTIVSSLFAVAALGGLAAMGACGSDDAGEPLAHKLEELNTEITELQDLVAAHKTAIDSASSTSVMGTEEIAYGSNAMGYHDGLHLMMEELGECARGFDLLGAEVMDETLDALDAELAAHSTAMSNATDVDAARTEEARHQQAMDNITAEFRTHQQAMGSDAAGFMCSGHHGDHA